MALIKCSECGKEISDKAKACIHCGCPIEEEEVFNCGNCGAEVQEDDTKCPECGFSFEEEPEEIEFVREQLEKNDGNIIQTINSVVNKYGMDLLTAKRFVNKIADDEEVEVPRYIIKTIIVSSSSKKKASSAIGRAAIGGALLGPAGLLAGTTAKSKDTTTFQVIYNDGTQISDTVKNNSMQFKNYCRFLEK